MIGTHFEENHIATGFGNHMAVPILRGEWREDLTFEEAVKLIEKCLLVLLYRDRSSINKFQVRTCPLSELLMPRNKFRQVPFNSY
jgi:20S proteasome subunit beta 7